MSTICKIAILSDEQSVCSAIVTHLEGVGEEISCEVSKWPLSGEREYFSSREDEPTILSVKQVTDAVVEIGYNSFSMDVRGLPAFLSSTLQAKTVVNIYQSVSTGCYWAYYKDGEKLREISSAENEIDLNNGSKMDFEGEHLGSNLAEDGEEPYYSFSDLDMDRYNARVGIPIMVYQNSAPTWQNYTIGNVVTTKLPKEVVKDNTNPWWMFWA